MEFHLMLSPHVPPLLHTHSSIFLYRNIGFWCYTSQYFFYRFSYNSIPQKAFLSLLHIFCLHLVIIPNYLLTKCFISIKKSIDSKSIVLYVNIHISTVELQVFLSVFHDRTSSNQHFRVTFHWNKTVF